MKNGARRFLLSLLCIFTALAVVSCSPPASKVVNAAPVTVLIWHYYNGVQKQLFDQLVTQFNSTVGEEKGIVVEAVNQGSVNELAQKTLDSLAHKVGALDAPDVFAAYADTVYQASLAGGVVDIGTYLTADEKSAYLDTYLEEGDLDGNGSLYIFPIAKATEVLILNDTDWQPFAQATGAKEADLATWEGIARLAQMYYQWTDSLTDTPEDGKAFFGRDAMANYMLVGCAQLGKELFQASNGKATLQMDQFIIRRLWDCYYVPYISGYFASFGRFRSDDVKTGDLIAIVGSTSSAAFYPTEVTLQDGSTYPITGKAYPAPNFEGEKPYAVQQGAGMAIVKSKPKTEEAAVTFLKWFTNQQQNTAFSVSSGYLPVKKQAENAEILSNLSDSIKNPIVRDVLVTGQAMTNTYVLFSGKPFQGGNDARAILEASLQKKAVEDRLVVLKKMAEGTSREDAIALLNTKAHFIGWHTALLRQLELALGIRENVERPRFRLE